VVSPTAPLVLVVDDDANVVEVLGRYLEREGYRVQTATDGLVALDLALRNLPDLVVLDLMLPGIGGLELCRRLRQVAPIPILMLTARGEESDRIIGLELGADDYVAKPFSPREVTARVRAVLRRSAQPSVAPVDVAPLVAGGLVVDVRAHEVRLDGDLVTLTVREFDLLVFFMRQPRRVFGRAELLEEVWGYTYGDASTVTVHVRRLREKMEKDPSHPTRLLTVWGVGYRFDDPPGATP